MNFKSVNPYNGETINTYTALDQKQLDSKLELAQSAFSKWKKVPLERRIELLKATAEVLRVNCDKYAEMISLEMGKPISESIGEIKKCSWVCDYYADHAESFLADEKIDTDAELSFVRHDPIGAVFAVMPWNFPFWQVFRFAAPTLVAGNVGLLKHAPNVFGCSILIEDIFSEAGFPEGVFQNLIVHHDRSEQIIAHSAVRATTLTGSEVAGSAVASLSGKYLKKSLLELGGNNAFIVLDDADIEAAVKIAVIARMLNAGQSCIAAKRFILMESIHDEFVTKFEQAIGALKSGDPLDPETQIGPLARLDLADQLQSQVKDSIEQGALLLSGGSQDGCYHEPTILTNVQPGMRAFDEETFGPLASMIKVKNLEEAIEMAERSSFGLGLTICTQNQEAVELAAEFSDGAVFINEFVKSDPRLPFGGTKKSGYGRELSKDGMMEFINRKTVYVK